MDRHSTSFSPQEGLKSWARTLADGQSCRVHTFDVETGTDQVVFETTDILLEAPNWTHDDRLIVNGDGVLWSLEPSVGADLIPIALEVPELNNDHVLAPDGQTIFVSANDFHIYSAPLSGGVAVRVTPDDGKMHFLHGISPDGTTLAYIGVVSDPAGPGPGEEGWSAEANVYTIGVDGTGDRQLTFGDSPADGSEYTPDGAWIYFNTEAFSDAPGHAQIARMKPDGTATQQLTFDERVNWFPHISPNGRTLVYLSFPPGTLGHPPDLSVELRLVRDGAWDSPATVAAIPGGQGTINVNSWSPDSQRFAYVDYPTLT